ncbi:type VI secretion system contractile sheath domain-containing protein [Leptolyngbya sp. 7M]|uniref:type VI secretion system contractile sheath domain-containing protein n=1 Tax=Leptolyngbya sp. 7M TaxID=2812896 RepID=UPI001B8D28FB|nr:type VI secretion system contractile sheath large subunit [Leptolyngbya sp. 7M]QYO66237.1 type VI secretion system contractile sheath large subunit [Leptolyngbya sp. 7M]
MVSNDPGLEASFTLEDKQGAVIEEPPFRMLILGDWSGKGVKAPLADRRPTEIDRDNFDEVLGLTQPKVEIDMEGGARLELVFRELDDFHPDQIFRQIPLFAELRDLRKRLNSEETFHAAARDVRERFSTHIDRDGPETFSEDATVTGVSADDLLDAILDRPAGGGSVPKPKPSDDLGALVADLVRPHLVSIDDTERSAYVAAVDEATSTLMRTILHHPGFKELEAAWRGLYLLVRRTETSPDLKLFILDIAKEELAEDLRSVDDLEQSVIYKQLLTDTRTNESWAALIGNYDLLPEIDDIALLMRTAKIAAAANAPFISHMRPDVLGVHSLHENPDPADWRIADDSSSAKLWAAVCDQSEAVYIGLTTPRFLGRLPYGSDTDPLEGFLFEEFADVPAHDDYLWANSAFIAGHLLAATFSERGWEMGRHFKQDIDGLPLHIYKEGTETVYKPCGEVLLSDRAVELMIAKGLMPLVSYKSTDKVKLAMFQSIAGTALNGRWY